MGRNKIVIWSGIFAVLALGSLFFYQYKNDSGKKVPVYQISVIVAEDSFENKDSLRLGLNQAGRDFGAEITQVSLYSRNNVEDQADRIRREAADGADAILLVALNDERVKEALEEIDESVPVIIVGSTVNGYDGKETILCNNYALGADMGQRLTGQREQYSQVALVQYGFVQNEIREKYEGVYQVLTGAGIPVVEWHLEETDTNAQQAFFQQKLMDGEADIIVAFDAGMLETLAGVKEGLSRDSDDAQAALYGFGYSTAVVQYMDRGVIDCVGLAEEYSYGYLGVKAAVCHLTGRQYMEAELQYHIIDKEAMFDEENQRWLFPIG